MKYRHLIVNDKEITNSKVIERILIDNEFYWLVDAEFEEAEIKIENNTIIWQGGIWLSGTWVYGIWENGEFRWGRWMNGIFLDGKFLNGTWESGIFKGGEMKGDVKVNIINKK